MPTPQGSIRLFKFAGITVYLDWSWLLIAVLWIQYRGSKQGSLFWCALEYLALFLIVLTHEFGHALACRQVGGKAEQIVLWPLGGVAYVAPPPRPGAVLWSIVAGPLVNVILVPILTLLWWATGAAGWAQTAPNLYGLIEAVFTTNFVLLFFNLLPIYPLDGGQILQSLLWFVIGRARSLMVSVIIGFIGVAVLIGLALLAFLSGNTVNGVWLGVGCLFIFANCRRGLMEARMLARLGKLPRRSGFACPDCKQPPVRARIWRCARCMRPFDMFETQAECPYCGAQYPAIVCLDCGNAHPLNEWVAVPPLPTVIVSPPGMPGSEAER